MYHKELAESGHRLFSIRGGYIYTVIILAAVIAWWTQAAGPFVDQTYNFFWQIAAFAVAMTGAIWRVIIGGFAALGTSGNAKKEAEAAELNVTGPYSIVRNPLYVGRIINFTGLAMMSGSWVFGAITFLVSVLIYERISMYEERFLIDKFGDAHKKWAENVPALMPKFSGWIKPKHKFWWRRAIRREYKKMFQLASAIILCDFARRGFELPDDMTGYYIYGGIVVIRLIIGAARQFGGVFDGIK